MIRVDFKSQDTFLFVISFLMMVLFMFTEGCSSTKTVTHESTAYKTEQGSKSSVDGKSVVKETTTTTTTEEKPKEEHPGVLGATLHLIGDVLAFPFRLVAGIIDAIF